MKNKKLVFGILSGVLAVAGGSGCGMIRNLEDMHDDTHNMSGTTAGMASTTNHMSTQTDHLANQTDHMANTTDTMSGNVAGTYCTASETYAALRQGNSLQSRAGINSLGEMKQASSVEGKIFYAGAYMKAFEFQIPNCYDPNADLFLKSFYQQAAEEFVRVLPEYLSDDHTKWFVSPTKTDNDSEDLYAFSVSLQELNANAVTAWKLKRLPSQPQSLLDVFKATLLNKEYLAAHPERVSLADHQFLFNQGMIVQLLKVRMNFLMAMALAKISHVQDTGFLGIPGLLREAGMFLGGWTSELGQDGMSENLELIKEVTRYVYGANDTFNILSELGMHPERSWDPTIRKFYNHMRTAGSVQPPIANPASDADLAFNNTQAALKDFLGQLRIYFGQAPFVKNAYLDHPEFFQD